MTKTNEKGSGDVSPEPLNLLAPGAGFEPATNRLTVDCSTAELSGNGGRGNSDAVAPAQAPKSDLRWIASGLRLAGCGRAGIWL